MPGAQTCYTLPMGVSARKLMLFARGEREETSEQCNAEDSAVSFIVMKNKNLLPCRRAEEKE